MLATDDVPLLIEAAKRAGDIAKSHFGQSPEVWDKADNAGPVTAADLAVNAMLHDMLRAARPDYGWLSEEDEDSTARQSAERVFVIDPIDGTRAFIEGGKDWGHSIAVVENGNPIAAAVAMPMRDQIYSAGLGAGAYLNDETINVSAETDPAKTAVLTAKPNLFPEHWTGGTPPPFKRTFRSSLAYRMALAACGRFDAMLTLRPTWEWDIAAGTLLVTEAGGTVTDHTGATLRFNNGHPQVQSVLAGGAVHAPILAALA